MGESSLEITPDRGVIAQQIPSTDQQVLEVQSPCGSSRPTQVFGRRSNHAQENWIEVFTPPPQRRPHDALAEIIEFPLEGRSPRCICPTVFRDVSGVVQSLKKQNEIGLDLEVEDLS
jgi:hypothetical protein